MSGRSPVRTVLIVIVCILVLEALGAALASYAGSTEANPWFEALLKPALQPPGPVFGLAWSILYALIGAALGLVIAAGAGLGRGLAVGLFLTQFALNLAWSPLFFRFHRMSDAFWLIGAMFILSLVTTWRFWVVRRSAGLLMIPYLGWLVFAAVLNWQIVQLNPGGGSAISAGASAAIPPQ